jgi:hypothetical protein
MFPVYKSWFAAEQCDGYLMMAFHFRSRERLEFETLPAALVLVRTAENFGVDSNRTK